MEPFLYSVHTLLPYRRSSGTCQLLVGLTTLAPVPSTETATFDRVIRGAIRVIEGCDLNSRPDVEHWGGAALAGLDSYLDVVVCGTPDSDGNETYLYNETVA